MAFAASAKGKRETLLMNPLYPFGPEC